MAGNVKAIAPGADKNKNRDLFDSTAHLMNTQTDELVIALCGPIGSPHHIVADILKKRLEEQFGYDECKVLRLSEYIKEHSGHDYDKDDRSEFDITKQYIKDGDELREQYGCGILAELAIADISYEREEHREQIGGQGHKPRRYCHIIDSVKNQEELDVLRLVYGNMLYFIGVFSPLSVREKNLERKGSGMTLGEIHSLIDQDSGEEFEHGQTVRDTFPQSDLFLRIDNPTEAQIEKKIGRFLELMLGSKIHTPTSAETAMYLADTAAANSACLSRQVGASITDSEGEILAVGWNDVPKPFGGLYMADLENDPISERDHRCWNKEGGGACSNDEQKVSFADHLIKDVLKYVENGKEEEVKRVLLKNPKLRGLIEFSRSVHAEMHAIINAGHSAGARIKGGKLYCTTYPCHSCARHIVAAGISEVYYIEPYRKSLATKLHDDAITEDEKDNTKVRIIPFEGVAPSRYSAIFRVKPDSRKSDGKIRPIDTHKTMPKQSRSIEAMPTLESIVVKGLKEKQLIPSEED